MARLIGYLEITSLIIRMGTAISANQTPSFIDWRLITKELSDASHEMQEKVNIAKQQSLSGEDVTSITEAEFSFHGKLIDMVQELDTAVQDLDWAGGVRRQGSPCGIRSALIGASLLILSLTISFFSGTKDGSGISDAVRASLESVHYSRLAESSQAEGWPKEPTSAPLSHGSL